MRKVKHILVVVDPTAADQPCVAKGARLARSFGAVLELYICDYQTSMLVNRWLPDDVVQAALKDRRVQLESQLHALAAPLREAGLRVLTDNSFQEHLHTAVIGKVRTSRADLVLKDTHYHGAIRRVLFTISDWLLIRECPVPLLLTKPSPWHARIRLAAALDPGHADDKPAQLDRELLENTEQFAASVGGEVFAVHAFDALPLVASMMSVANSIGNVPLVDYELINTQRKFHAAGFNAFLAPYPAFQGRGVMIEGSPTAALPDYVAQQEIDVLVTGAVSRSALRRLMVGSTAESLLDRLPCDILVVKPTPEENENDPAATS